MDFLQEILNQNLMSNGLVMVTDLAIHISFKKIRFSVIM